MRHPDINSNQLPRIPLTANVQSEAMNPIDSTAVDALNPVPPAISAVSYHVMIVFLLWHLK